MQIAPRKKKGKFLYTIIGTIIDWYQFAIITNFLHVISRQFLPEAYAYKGPFMMLFLFSCYASRIFGGVLFGHLGDTYGRKVALRFSVALMSAASILLALLPTYHQIGLLAPALLIFARVLQGLGVGGEYPNAMSYCFEHYEARRSLFTSFVSGSCALGILIGNSVSIVIFYLMSGANVALYGWRIPIILGGLVSLFFSLRRFAYEETPDFLHGQKETGDMPLPFKRLLVEHKQSILSAVLFGSLTGLLYTACHTGLVVFKTHQNTSFDYSYLLSSVFIVIACVVCPISGMASDKIGPRFTHRVAASLLVILAFPAYLMLAGTSIALQFAAQILLGIILGITKGGLGHLIASSFPMKVRSSGIAVTNNLIAITTYCLPVFLMTMLQISSGFFIFSLLFLIGLLTVFTL